MDLSLPRSSPSLYLKLPLVKTSEVAVQSSLGDCVVGTPYSEFAIKKSDSVLHQISAQMSLRPRRCDASWRWDPSRNVNLGCTTHSAITRGRWSRSLTL